MRVFARAPDPGLDVDAAGSGAMNQERSSAYRGATREAAEAAYHADARVMARMGYTPASEDWSTAREQVLTVRYVHAPEQASAVLEALAEAETVRSSATFQPPRPVPNRRLGRAAGLYEMQTLEVKLAVGEIAGIAGGIALWWLLAGPILGDNPILLFLGLFGLGFAGMLIGAMLTLNHHSRGR